MVDSKSLVFDINQLSKLYKKKVAVENLSFNGYAGEIVGFLGPNGAGKTTTIKMMTGLIGKSSGRVMICGHDLDESFEQAIACVGAIVETPYLYEHLSGLDNLKLFAKAKQADEAQLQKMINLTKLESRLKDKVKTYSLGMKQRLGIAVALMGNPPLLILDEPTNGLDPVAIRELRDFLKELAHEQGVCLLISSHMLWEMEKLCDRVVIINNGKLIGEVSIQHLKAEDGNLEDYYIQCIKTGNQEVK